METQYINLSMTPIGVTPTFHISQYDVGRTLGFIVHSGGATVDLDTYTCTIEATRSDGTAITSAVATTDNIGTFEVTPTMSNKADKYKCQLVIVDENSKRIASLPFDMEVTKAAMDENSESIEEDASLYQQYTEAVQGEIAEANADIQAEASTRASADSNLQSQINQIVAPSGEAPSAAEVQNARIGADGVTYSTLGDAIRTQNSNLKSASKTLANAETLSFDNDGYIKPDEMWIGGNGTLTVYESNDYIYYSADCSYGDVFYIAGYGGFSPRLYGVISSHNKLIMIASEDKDTRNNLMKIVIPQNGVKVFFNVRKTTTHELYKEITATKEETVTAFETANEIEFTSGKYVKPSQLWVNGYATPSFINDEYYSYAVADCKKGDIFVISGATSSNNDARLYYLASYNNRVIQIATQNTVGNNTVIIIPDNVVKLYANAETSSYHKLLKYSLKSESVEDIAGLEKTLKLEKIELTKGQYISSSSLKIGDICTNTIVEENGWASATITVSYGDWFIINAKGGVTPRLYFVYDSNNKLIDVATSNREGINLPLRITDQGKKVVFNVSLAESYTIYKYTSSKNYPLSYNQVGYSAKSPTAGIDILSAMVDSIPLDDAMNTEISLYPNHFGNDETLILNNGIAYTVFIVNDADDGDDSLENPNVRLVLAKCNYTQTSPAVTIYEVAKINDTFSTHELTSAGGIPNCTLIGDTIHIIFCAQLDSADWYLLHRTFDITNNTFGTIEICKILNEEEQQFDFRTLYVNSEWLGRRQQSYHFDCNATIAKDGSTYYIGMFMANEPNAGIIMTTTDFVEYTKWTVPNIPESRGLYECACTIKNGYLYYAIRQDWNEGSLIIAKINMQTKNIVDKLSIPDCGSRPAFLQYNNTIYLLHSKAMRNRLEFITVDENYLCRSYISAQTIRPVSYPSVDIENSNLYMAATIGSRVKIYPIKLVKYQPNRAYWIFRRLVDIANILPD